MHLVPFQSVDDLASCLLQHPGPADIVLLVKAGSELYQNHDLFSVLSSLAERLNDLALFRQAVQGHLDRDHAVILSGLVQHVEERADRLIRIRQQLIFLLDLLEDAHSVPEGRRFLRHSLLIEQLCVHSKEILDLIYKGQIQRRLAAEYTLREHVKITAERFHNRLIDLP